MTRSSNTPSSPIASWIRLWQIPFAIVLALWCSTSHAVTISREISKGASAVLDDGRRMFLQVRVPAGAEARPFLLQFLVRESDWKVYSAAASVAIPFNKIKSDVRRDMLLAVFDKDYVDDAGWHHVALAHDQPYQESLFTLAEWLTGQGYNHEKVMAANGIRGQNLTPGQAVLFPKDLLLKPMQAPTPERVPKAVDLAFEEEPELPDLVDLEKLGRELTYTPREQPRHAVYELKKGEALYTAVVVRFTNLDLGEGAHQEILVASQRIADESGIRDVHHIKVGQKILIPIEMLADRFKPATNADRKDYEETLVEARKLKGAVKSKDLDGVVVVLDPGHGGRDQGAINSSYSLVEDELNYDIAQRVKHLLESSTQARVYTTMLDPNRKNGPDDSSAFSHDTDEVVSTSPRYPNSDGRASVSLRWLLANQYMRAEQAKKVDPMKMIFISIHTDSLYNSKLRGAMVYIPGARGVKERENAYPPDLCGKYVKSTSELRVSFTAAERRRNEALSRNFAENLLRALERKRIKCHSQSDPIRTQILQDGGKVYVPGVLRGTLIPTKVLLETANLRNEADCKNLRDPKWRQRLAEAVVSALRAQFGA
jgi:N-acetylmuramoyl-L-alanine amidase